MKPFALLLVVLIGASSCKKLVEPAQPSLGGTDLKKVLYLGGSWLSGMQNNVWDATSQNQAPCKLLYGQFAQAGAVDEFSAPELISLYGLGLGNPHHLYKSKTSVIVKQFACDASSQFFIAEKNTSEAVLAKNYLAQHHVNGIYNALAFPYATMASLTATNPAYSSTVPNPFYPYFASQPGVSTVLQDAQRINASFAVLQVGMDDIYNWAQQGGSPMALPIPASAIFENKLESLLQALQKAGMHNGVICTIPAISCLPYYSTLPPMGVQLDTAQAAQLNALYGYSSILKFRSGKNGFVAESAVGTTTPSYSQPIKMLQENESILLSVNADSLKCLGMGVFFPILDEYVLDEAELAKINQAILSYNAIIKQKAADYNLAVADWYSVMNEVKSGKVIDGLNFNTKFISGGFFSSDGQTPTAQGYAILTNEIIRAINLKFNATIAPLAVTTFAGIQLP